MTEKKLKEILDKHLKWLNNEEGGERASFRGSNLQNCDLRGSDLRGSDLRNCDLRGSDLRDSDLQHCDLRDSNLQNCDLRGSDLRGSNLQNCDLRDSNLQHCDLRDSNLQNCNLRDSNLQNIKNTAKIQDLLISYTSICPEGTIVGWKKCRNNIIVKLEIPAEARRSNATGRKCRAEYADVIEVIDAETAISQHDSTVEYKAGQRVYPDSWDENRWNECSSGIHFFITRLEAENY